MDKYNFGFEEVRILEVDFKVKVPEKGGDIDVNPTLNFGHKIDGNFLEVTLGILFDDPAAPFKFNIIGYGKFKFTQDIEKTFGEKIKSVAIINCSSIIFPFLREAVAELTRKAGFNPMLLPPVNFVNIFNSIEREESERAKTIE